MPHCFVLIGWLLLKPLKTGVRLRWVALFDGVNVKLDLFFKYTIKYIVFS